MSKRTTSEQSPWIQTQQLSDIADQTGNIYRSIANLEEVHENREQIEISKYYEKLPHPTILAMEEFKADGTYYRFRTEEEMEGTEEA